MSKPLLSSAKNKLIFALQKCVKKVFLTKWFTLKSNSKLIIHSSKQLVYFFKKVFHKFYATKHKTDEAYKFSAEEKKKKTKAGDKDLFSAAQFSLV